jgi:hypothetical protein
MTTVYIEAGPDAPEVLSLVRAAVEGEARRLELALDAARRRLARFEEKYGVTSERFMAEMAAEDLEGGDDEYVQWAGEFRLMERLTGKLARLQEIRFENHKHVPDRVTLASVPTLETALGEAASLGGWL